MGTLMPVRKIDGTLSEYILRAVEQQTRTTQIFENNLCQKSNKLVGEWIREKNTDRGGLNPLWVACVAEWIRLYLDQHFC